MSARAATVCEPATDSVRSASVASTKWASSVPGTEQQNTIGLGHTPTARTVGRESQDTEQQNTIGLGHTPTVGMLGGQTQETGLQNTIGLRHTPTGGMLGGQTQETELQNTIGLGHRYAVSSSKRWINSGILQYRDTSTQPCYDTV